MTQILRAGATILCLASFVSAQELDAPYVASKVAPAGPRALPTDADETVAVAAPPPVARRRPAAPAASRRLTSPVVLPAGNARWRFFHDKAALVGGINVKGWREGGGLGSLVEQAKGAGAPPAMIDMVEPMLREVDEVWFVADASSRNSEPLVLISGRFTSPLWQQVLSTRQPLGKNVNAVLVGPPLEVAKAKRRFLLARTVPSPLAKEAEEFSSKNDLWLAGLPKLMPKEMVKQSGAAGNMAGQVERFMLAMSLRDKLTADLNIQTASPEVAQTLLGIYRLAEQQAAASNPKEWEQFGKSLKVEQESASVKFHLAVDTAELRPLVEARMKSAQQEPQQQQTARKDSPRGPMIRIEGLESGPREIPLNGRQ